MKMKYVVLALLTVLIYSCGSGGRSTPQELFKKAHQAVLDQDIDALSECITQKENMTAEMTKAFAELIIYVKSGEYQQFRDTYKTRLEETKTHAMDQAMLQAFGVNFMPDFDKAAEKGEYNAVTKVYKVESEGQPLTYTLDEKDGLWSFWVTTGKPNPAVIEGMEFLKNLEPALALSTVAESKAAIEELIQKYIKPTDLEYSNQSLSGKMSGVDWAMLEGKAEQSFRDGKGRITLSLADTKLKDECRIFLDGSKVYLSFERPGTYDFGQTGLNLTLAYAPKNSNKMVVEGKVDISVDQENRVVRGKITAKLDGDNFVNGTFEVPFCGDIVLD